MVLNRQISDKQFIIFEFSLIILSVLFPLLIDLPYRVNIFLTWEGTYRMYLGQMPYKDFGIPLGYGFFLIPLLFFKIFGPYLHTLVLAQVLINFISLLAFRNILKILGVNHSQRSLSLLVFCLSYSFFNFWPWYNHSVFVFQMVGFNFLLLSFFTTQKAKSYLWLFIASVFIFLAFFTKQDSGGLAIIFAGILLSYIAWLEKKIPLFILYCLSIFLIGVFFIGPLLPYDFSYWFNYGQAPHSSRLHVIDFLNKILGNSNWEKLYIGIIGIIFIRKIENFRVFIHDKKEVLFFLITIGVIVQSLIVKVTSPLPTDHQSYFHGFAFAYIFWNIRTGIQWNTYKYALASFAFVFFWWSALYWDYFGRLFPLPPAPTTTGLVAPPPPPSKPWVTSNYVSMAKIKMPPGTIDGIEKLINLEEVKNKKDLKVLNMSELTPLAYELKYIPETDQPLWYHLHIGMFQKQVDQFCSKIGKQHYDLILYQDIPNLPTFYPQELKPCLMTNYQIIDKFPAPRKNTEGESFIYVFTRKK